MGKKLIKVGLTVLALYLIWKDELKSNEEKLILNNKDNVAKQ